MNKLLIAVSLLLLFQSCSKDENVVKTTSESKKCAVPFFELAKGDSIPKSVYRLKPDVKNKYRESFTSENEGLLKSIDNEYIYNLYITCTSKPNQGTVPANYIKLVPGGNSIGKRWGDLNEQAGGAWINLWYTKIKGREISPLTKLYIACSGSSSPVPNPLLQGYAAIDYFCGHRFGVHGVDLNYDAGGDFIYLYTKRASNFAPIKEIGLIVSNYRNPLPDSGYEIVNSPDIPTGAVDLNSGAGGYYIYLEVKR